MKKQIDKQAIEEIKDHIDNMFGCDCAYYGVDGLAIASHLYNEGYRKQSEIADDIIAIIEQSMARNIERLNGCQSDIWKVGYLAKNEAYQDIKEIIEQRMKGGAE